MKIPDKKIIFAIAALSFICSCQKYLDRTPLSSITPEQYLNDETQLAAYAIAQYTSVLPSNTSQWDFGTFGTDGNTDNMAIPSLDNKWIPGQWKVGATGGDWDFSMIYQENYFLENVLPKYKANTITGSADNIKQYIGEVYFLRAYTYFTKLQALGDFPILRTTLPNDATVLTDSSNRRPCNEVARFILSDLDSAISLLKETAPGNKTRISKYCAELVKSRVALYEGTWLKYFKGTAFVPNGPNWPGKTKTYNASYAFPSGSIDGEIDYFLGEAMSAAKSVADVIPLVNNTGSVSAAGNSTNPYFTMFGALDMSGYGEVLLWRQYSKTVTTHDVPYFAASNNYAVGLTKSMVESYLMSNGLPIYTSGSGYQGDDYISDLKKNRDVRLQLFLKVPGDTNVLTNVAAATAVSIIEPVPYIWQSAWSTKYTTGYTIRKGLNYDGLQDVNGGGYTGSIVFRAAEAYLNYIEASYEKNGSLDGDALRYWQALRSRAGVSTDVQQTIAATVMSKETADWGAYSAGSIVSPTLYNIRRERRDELMGEGLRFMDLKRWRALDQLISTPYHVEGFKLWGPMKSWFTASQLTYGAGNSGSVVSDPVLGNYLRPYEILSSSLSYNGVKWSLAHYLSPIAINHFNITSTNGDYSTSPIYQNPGWPLTAGSGPTGN